MRRPIGFNGMDRAKQQKDNSDAVSMTPSDVDDMIKQVGYEKAVKTLLQFLNDEIPVDRFTITVVGVKRRYFDEL